MNPEPNQITPVIIHDLLQKYCDLKEKLLYEEKAEWQNVVDNDEELKQLKLERKAVNDKINERMKLLKAQNKELHYNMVKAQKDFKLLYEKLSEAVVQWKISNPEIPLEFDWYEQVFSPTLFAKIKYRRKSKR